MFFARNKRSTPPVLTAPRAHVPSGRQMLNARRRYLRSTVDPLSASKAAHARMTGRGARARVEDIAPLYDSRTAREALGLPGLESYSPPGGYVNEIGYD